MCNEAPKKQEALFHPLFEGSEHLLFPAEMDYYDASFPWESDNHAVENLLASWTTIHQELKRQFEEREHASLEKMQAGIAAFIKLLFWTNEEPVNMQFLSEKAATLAYKPVNIGDRLSFILSRPKSYQSFIQLSELMIEQQKQLARKKIFIARTRI